MNILLFQHLHPIYLKYFEKTVPPPPTHSLWVHQSALRLKCTCTCTFMQPTTRHVPIYNVVHLIISNKHYTVVAKNYTFNNDATLFISTSTITKLFIKRINDINWPEKHQFYFAHDIPGTKIGIEQKITHRTHSSEQNNSSNF